jgi:hypothetical protein
MDSPRTASRHSVLAALRDTEHRWVNRLLYVALGVLAAVLVLQQFEEPFEVASGLGDLELSLAAGYVSAWIFHYLTVWRPRRRERLAAERHVARGGLLVASQANQFFRMLADVHPRAPTTPCSPTALRDWMRSISLQQPANIVPLLGPSGVRGTVADAAAHATQCLNNYLRLIERWPSYTDAEMLRLVYEVHDCGFLEEARLDIFRMTNMVLDYSLGDAIVEWFELSDNLRTWICDHLGDGLSQIGFEVEDVRGGRLIR